MLSAGDIRGVLFNKQAFGGYSMAEVDVFLEQCAQTVEALRGEDRRTICEPREPCADTLDAMRALIDRLEAAVAAAEESL